jgi:hypothetical protein
MSRILLGAAVAAGALFCAAPVLAKESCSRHQLQSAVKSYLAAQKAGDPSKVKAAKSLTYKEDRKPAEIGKGVLTKKLDIQFQRSLLDTEQCETFTEMVDSKAPNVLGVHLTVKKGKVAEIDTLVTKPGDWLFNAKNFLAWAPEEDWGTIPKKDRDSRETLVAAGNAYLDRFGSTDVKVPWGQPCRRLEGGARTGKGAPDDSCEVGVPQGVKFPIRHFVVDTDVGAATALVAFGGEGGLPDAHSFRVEHGKLRWVHTITVCGATMKCPQANDGGGFGPPGTGQAAAQNAGQAQGPAPKPATPGPTPAAVKP